MTGTVGWFEWFACVTVFLVALSGGWLPLTQREKARDRAGFPLGQAFAAGVFLALSLSMMLPAGSHVLSKAYPHVAFPLASVGSLVALVGLVALQHSMSRQLDTRDGVQISPAIPLIMTVMIAVPSFLLGTALSLSEAGSALMILVAIVAHKGTAGFALALKMVRSSMSPAHTWMAYLLFAMATPAGILIGAEAQHVIAGTAVTVTKGVVLSLASGVFLFMATLHDLEDAPLIRHCRSLSGFVSMLAGLVLTVAIRVILGLAHTGHPGGS